MTNDELIQRLMCSDLREFTNLNMLFQLARNLDNMDLNREVRRIATAEARSGRADAMDFFELAHKTYILGGRKSFDDFMIAVEWYRDPKARFWLPRRSVLEGQHGIASKIQRFLEDPNSLYLGFSLAPGTGKSALIKFLLAYIYGQYSDSMSMYVSYSDGMVKMMYDSVSGIITNDEYAFADVFPETPRPTCSAEYYTISARGRGDFPTLGLISLGGSVTGRTRANKLLITDDLVKNAEVARSPERLEKLYQDYQSTITTRTIGENVKQIMLGTIWSKYDPISRMREKYEDDPRYTFIAIPVCDEEGHSLFYYDHPDRYSDERIADLKEKLDPVDFSCLYMQRGIDKEGIALPRDSVNWYNGVLPDGEPDNILFYADVAFGGGDSFSMPIAYVYGDSVYIHDVVFDKGNKAKTQPRVIGKILMHRIKMGRFEANAGGDAYCEEVNAELRRQGYTVNLTHKRAPVGMSKETRIEQFIPDIQRWYFRDGTCRDKEYERFVDEFTSYSFTSKNRHDDAIDSLAGLAGYINRRSAPAKIVERLW